MVNRIAGQLGGLFLLLSSFGGQYALAADDYPDPSPTYQPTQSPYPTLYPVETPPAYPTYYPTPAPTYQATATPTCTTLSASASCSCSGFLSGTTQTEIQFNSPGQDIHAACYINSAFNFADVWCSEISMEDVVNDVFSSSALNCYCSTPYFYASGYITDARQQGSITFPSLFQAGDLLHATGDAQNDVFNFSASYRYNSCTGETGSVSITGRQGLGEDFFGGEFNFPLTHGQVSGSGVCTESGEFHGAVGGSLSCREIARFCSISGYIAARRENEQTTYSAEGDVAFSISHWGYEGVRSTCSGGATFSASNSPESGGDDAIGASLRAWLDYRW
ncbi:MAG: hypothetical protein J5J00_09020 [Deltaproteobacteria bacterium]|nr:hypothetical protein [Deltaproteobacteria bacterium]